MIRQFLDLSTAYLSRETFDMLEACPTADHLPVSGGVMHYGWFLYARHDGDLWDGLPPDLKEVITFAKAKGCDYVMFDVDGPEIEDLTVYNHGSADE